MVAFPSHASEPASAASACVWAADHSGLVRLPAAGSAAAQSVPIQGITALAVDGKCAAYAVAKKRLLKVDHTGTTVFDLDVGRLDTRLVNGDHISVNPYDGSIWIADANTLVHLDAHGSLLSSARTPGPVRAIALGQSGQLWSLGNKELWKNGSLGELRENVELPAAHQATRLLVEDSLGQIVWIAGEKQLSRVTLAPTPKSDLSLALPGQARSLAVNPQSGELWVLADESVTVFLRDGSQQQKIDLTALGFPGATHLVFDPVAQTVWIAGRDELLQLDAAGAVLGRTAMMERTVSLAAPMLQLVHSVSLQRPTSGSVSNNPRPVIGYRTEMLCNDSPCSATAVETAEVSLAVTLNGKNIGPFLREPAVGEAQHALVDSLPEGINVLSASARDRFGHVSAQVDDRFTIDTVAPAFLSVLPPPGTVFNGESAVIEGVVDDPGATVVLAGSAAQVQAGPSGATLVFSIPVTLVPGNNIFSVDAIDQAGNRATREVALRFAPPLPPAPVSSQISVGKIVGGSVVVTGNAGAVAPLLQVLVGNARSGQTMMVLADATGAFSTSIAASAGDSITVSVSNKWGSSAPISISIPNAHQKPIDPTTVDGIVPPDPATIAPALSPLVPTSLAASTAFLYTGPDAIQAGVAPGTIEERRVAVVRGRVLDQDGQPFPAVRVRVAGHPEFGHTFSRADGRYDLAVNGGGDFTLIFDKSGVLPAHRKLQTPWKDYVQAPDVALVELDDKATVVDLASSQAMQVAQGSVVTDADGTRQVSVLFPAGVTATILKPDGSEATLPAITFRATEYTVGENGPARMPAPLPSAAGYTYAVELSVDEAIAAGANTVNFSQAVPVLVDNFLNFNVGTAVPIGYYDRARSTWVASRDGLIIKVLSISDGLAKLDVKGSGEVADAALLASLQVSQEELRQIAQLYSAGKTLTRFMVTHFTPMDGNFPVGPPPGARAPTGCDASGRCAEFEQEREDSPAQECGSIIECDNQVLGEHIPLAGVPFGLNYRSNRAIGYSATRRIRVPLSDETLPSTVKRVEATIDIAGRRIHEIYEPRPGLVLEFEWDGKDAYGRQTVGRAPALVTIAYVYQGQYYASQSDVLNSFNTSSGVDLKLELFRSEVRLERKVQGILTAAAGSEAGVGGWTFDVHHNLDPNGPLLMLGDGSTHRGKSVNITSMGPTSQPSALVVDDQGTVISPADGGRKFMVDGTTAPLASNYLGLSTLAGDAWGNLYYPRYSFNAASIMRMAPDGSRSTVAGDTFDIPAALRKPMRPLELVVDRDGSIYFSENTALVGNYYQQRCQVRKLNPDGSISKVAGNGQCYGEHEGDGGPAKDAALVSPRSLAVDSLGNLYIADSNVVRKVTPAGLIDTIAGVKGGGCWEEEQAPPDGIAATEYCFGTIRSIAVDREDNLLIASDRYMNSVSHWRSSVVRVKGDGSVATLASSNGAGCVVNDTLQQMGPAASICSEQRFSAITVNADNEVLAAHGNKLVYVGDKQIRCVNTQGNLALSCEGAVAGVGEKYIPSQDGAQLYVFDKDGLHVRTVNTRTEAVLFSFSYDEALRLVAVTDGNGNVTRVERDESGAATAVIGPYGQRTALSVDPTGRLTSVSNPMGETYRMEYSPTGLLQRFESPRKLASRFEYDAKGRLIFDINAAGGSWQLDRSEDGEKAYEVAMHSAMGRSKVYRSEYEPNGVRRRTVIDRDGTKSVTVTTGVSSTTTSADGTVQTSVLGPDPRFGMLAAADVSNAITLPSGLTYSTSTSRTVVLNAPSDPFSLMSEKEVVNINGNVYRTDYDATQRQYTMTSPLNRKSTLSTNEQGLPLSRKTANLHPVKYRYDAQGRLVGISQGEGEAERHTASLVYNAQGFVESQTNAVNQTTRFAYDAAGRVTSLTLPNNRVIAYDYDENGNMVSIRPPGREPHQFEYNAADLPSTYAPPAADGSTVPSSFLYNLDKQLSKVNRPDGSAITYSYDDGGKLIDVSTATGTTKFNFDQTTGLLAGVTTGDVSLGYLYDGALPKRISFAGPVKGSLEAGYDQFFRVKSLDVNGTAVEYSYDKDGLLTGAGAMIMTRDSQNGLQVSAELGANRTTYSYDSFGQMSAMAVTQGSTELFSEVYLRDTLGRVVQKTTVQQGLSTVIAYEYDTSGRLASVRENGSLAGSYAYDANGNRISAHGFPASYDEQDRLVEFGGATYGYTANGEIARTDAGNRTTRYAYDGLGTLIQALLPDGRQIDYVIDGAQRRIGKKVDGRLTQGFLYQDQLRPAAELDADNNIVARFVYGERANVPEYMIKAGATYRLVLDRIGSVRMVVNVVTGEIAQQIDYDAWGNVLRDSNPGFQPFGYAGGLFDTDTGLVRFGARDFDPFTARWTSKDPIRFAGGDTNLYAYVHGNPISYTDPLGLWSVTFGGYVGPGFEITFGNDNGNGFMTARVGFGIGGGISYDPNGQIPGPRIRNGCEGGVVAAVSGAVNFNAGPVAAGMEMGAGRNYSSGESSMYGGPSASVSDSVRGLSATGSIGASVTIYSGR